MSAPSRRAAAEKAELTGEGSRIHRESPPVGRSALHGRQSGSRSARDVLHQGLAHSIGWTIGFASAVVGVAVLLAWVPLRNRPGIGTVANVVVIAVTVDASLSMLPTPTTLPVRVATMIGAVVLNALATVLYIGAGLGPGPRDGLMTGLVARTGRSVRLVRTTIEATALVGGWLLGGTVGAGTVVYAFGIGPLVQLMLRLAPVDCWCAAAGRDSG